MQTLARRRLAAPLPAARAARLGRDAREPDRPGDARRLRCGLHHHGADRVPGDVRLEHDLRRDGAARDAACVELREPETMLRLEAPAGVVEITARCRDGTRRERRADERALLRRRASTRSSRSTGSGRSRSTSRSAACGTRSPTRPSSGSRSSRARRATLRRAGERDPRRGARAAHPSTRRTRRSPVSIVADRRAVAGRRGGDEERRRRRAGAARPVGDRHRPLRADGGAARARADERRRHDDARVRDRLDVRRPDRRGDRGRRRPAIVPAIRGSAFITGAPSCSSTRDPFPEGYRLSDTWPGEDRQ